MPIEYRVDPAKRLVVARVSGTLTESELFEYQREVWRRPDVAGYDELVDMTAVERIAFTSADRVRELATVAAAADPARGGGKLAIVAPTDYVFGLGRMYAAYRELDPLTTKRVAVYRTMPEALEFLGLESPL